MKRFNNLSVKIAAALAAGFLFAGVGTTIAYECSPIDGAEGCVSYEKAVMHPSDLLHNKQNSLLHFSEIFVISSVVSFAVLNVSMLGKKHGAKGGRV